MQTVAQAISSLVEAMENCADSGNAEWKVRHGSALRALCRKYLPSGCGFDRGTALDLGASTPDKLVFVTSFHHMNADGFYTKWTDHTVTVKPALNGFNISVKGSRQNADYLAEAFDLALDAPFSKDQLAACYGQK